MNKEELINLLKSTKKETLAFYALDESSLKKTYGEGKWNVKQILNHLADTESILINRIKRAISNDEPTLLAMDQDGWEKALDYNNFSLEVNKAVFSSLRDATLYMTSNFYDLAESKYYIHSEMGKRNAKEEFIKIAIHNKNHLDQIKQALS